MLRRELPPNECCTLWEIQWALEAAEDLEAAAAAAAGLPVAAALADVCAPVPRTNSGGSATAGMAAAAGASSPLRSTVQGMAEAAARAVAEGAAVASSSGSGSGELATPLAARRHSSSAATAGEELPPEFLLQFIAAVVRGLRGRILAECAEHDDVLRLFSFIKVDFWLALAQARKQYRAYRQGSLVMRRLR